jgi:hypothetical protein
VFFGPITTAQVIIAALSSGKIKADDFVKGASLYGVDCPIPFITKKADHSHLRNKINTELELIDMKETVTQKPSQSIVDIKILA